MKKTMYVFAIIVALLIIAFFAVTSQSKFGAIPKAERMERIKQSPNYKDGKFQNLSETPQMSEEASFVPMVKEYFGAKNKKPNGKVPTIKTNLLDLKKEEDVLVWFGHSSYFMQVDGIKILVDPVFSGNASPFSFSVKAFEGSDVYSVADMPQIDYLLITHDHWDHLDYQTVMALKPKLGRIVSGLGVGAHFERWGFAENSIIETDWFDTIELPDSLTIHCTPTRHFSGRGFKAKQSLWASFVLETPSRKIFVGGDGGYDTHFAEIGEKYGPFDLAMLENGQYNKAWKYIHMMPEQVLQAVKDLHTKRFFPVHSGKFALANHSWDEPLKRISEVNKNSEIPMITPRIGEVVRLDDTGQQFSQWWLEVEK